MNDDVMTSGTRPNRTSRVGPKAKGLKKNALKPTWITNPEKHSLHVCEAGHRAATQRITPTIFEIGQGMRKCRADGKERRFHGKVHLYFVSHDLMASTNPPDMRILAVSLYGSPILYWLPDYEGERSPRFAVRIMGEEQNTPTTRRYINGLCHYFGVCFYVWQNAGELWAMFSAPVDQPKMLTIAPFMTGELVFATAPDF